uniref:BPTI/Kunitz inhibitor domain-containing protein n=1 Tax=Anser brachyrhynchus TaxID=132585 RepID=A0A8B9BWK6_9AVES
MVHSPVLPAACTRVWGLSLAQEGRWPPPHTSVGQPGHFCYLPSVCGNCKALFIRFFYNASSQRCEEFIYGGCGGNRNNFETKRESQPVPAPQRPALRHPESHGDPCTHPCSRWPWQPAAAARTGQGYPQAKCCPVLQSDICHLPPEHGPCRGHFYRYAYNPATGTCRVFLYGGCRGNANNFETLKECQRACQRGERRALGWTGLDWAGLGCSCPGGAGAGGRVGAWSRVAPQPAPGRRGRGPSSSEGCEGQRSVQAAAAESCPT